MQKRKLSRRAFGLGVGSAASLVVGGQVRPPMADAGGPPLPGGGFIGNKENLVYDNPFHQKVGNAWYDGTVVHQLAGLNITAERPPFKTAEQYTFVYEDEFQAPRTAEGAEKQPRVGGQYVIYDSVPGQPTYSPIWHNHWILVPRSYIPNSIRSVEAVWKSGHRIIETSFYFN